MGTNVGCTSYKYPLWYNDFIRGRVEGPYKHGHEVESKRLSSSQGSSSLANGGTIVFLASYVSGTNRSRKNASWNHPEKKSLENTLTGLKWVQINKNILWKSLPLWFFRADVIFLLWILWVFNNVENDMHFYHELKIFVKCPPGIRAKVDRGSKEITELQYRCIWQGKTPKIIYGKTIFHSCCSLPWSRQD